MKAVIVQPFYLPWIGYFGMIDEADIFVFADNLQFLKKSWQRRNKIKTTNNTSKWITVPVTGKYKQNINEVAINNSVSYKQKQSMMNWKENHWELITSSYSKAPYFDDYKDVIEEIFTKDWDLLLDLDIYAIEKISELLGLKVPDFIKASDLNDAEGIKVDYILNVCNEVGADAYISGLAAKDYIDVNEFQKFKQKNVDLYWFEFTHPVYPQIGSEFIPYLSAIDLLFNTGERSKNYIRKSSENCLELEEGNTLKNGGGVKNE